MVKVAILTVADDNIIRGIDGLHDETDRATMLLDSLNAPKNAERTQNYEAQET